MKITFYGASVTAQSGTSGYVNALTKMLKNNGGFQIRGIGYGACHFGDAGFYRIGEVLKDKPSICILEWNTTGQGEFNQLKLNSVIYDLVRANIFVGLLILPRKNTNIISERQAEIQIIELSKKYGFPLLDLRKMVDIDLCLRDVVHTNDYGAECYAKEIKKWIETLKLDKQEIDESWQLNFSRNAFNNEIIIDKKNALEISFTYEDHRVCEIVFELIVGPSMLDLIIEGENIDLTRTFVDEWCYYDRKMYHLVFKGRSYPKDGLVSLVFKGSKQLPNYSELKKPIKNEDIKESLLEIKGVYTLGLKNVTLINEAIKGQV